MARPPLPLGRHRRLTRVAVDPSSPGPVVVDCEGWEPFEVPPGCEISWLYPLSDVAAVTAAGGRASGTVESEGLEPEGPPGKGKAR